MTFLFDPQKAVETLHALEKQWGGNATERMAAKYLAAEREPAASAAKPVTESQVEQAVQKADQPAPAPTAAGRNEVVIPPPEPLEPALLPATATSPAAAEG